MNPEIKAAWVAALRSGQYQPLRGALAPDEDAPGIEPLRRCCLGVLCDLAVEAGVAVKDMGYFRAVVDEADTSDQVLPDAVVVWANLDNPSPAVRLRRTALRVVEEPLAYLNDQRVPWAELAELIEEQL
jgi:hypothetical protein